MAAKFEVPFLFDDEHSQKMGVSFLFYLFFFLSNQDTLASMSSLALFLSEQKGRLGEAESLHRRDCARWAKRWELEYTKSRRQLDDVDAAHGEFDFFQCLKLFN